MQLISDGKRTRGEGIGEPDGPAQGTGSPVILESRTMISSYFESFGAGSILTLDPLDVRSVKPGSGALATNRMIVGVALEDVDPGWAVTVIRRGLIKVKIVVAPSTTISPGHWIVPLTDASNEANGFAQARLPDQTVLGPVIGYLLQTFTNSSPSIPSPQKLWCYLTM